MALPALDPKDYLSYFIPGMFGLILLYPLVPDDTSENILNIDGAILLPALVALSYAIGLFSSYFASKAERKHPYEKLRERVGNKRSHIENRFFKYAPKYFDIEYDSLGLYFRARSELYSKGDRGDETQKLESLYLLSRGLSFIYMLFGLVYVVHGGLDGISSLFSPPTGIFIITSVFLFLGAAVFYTISKRYRLEHVKTLIGEFYTEFLAKEFRDNHGKMDREGIEEYL